MTMQKFFGLGLLQDSEGFLKVADGYTATVTSGDGTATIYEDDETTTKANPITLDANGRFEFKAPTGTYSAKINDGNGTTAIITNIVLRGGVALTETAVSKTLVGGDDTSIIIYTSDSNGTITLPQNSTENLPTGFTASIINIGTGTLSFTTEGSDTLESDADSTDLITQYGVASVIKRASGKWVLLIPTISSDSDLFGVQYVFRHLFTYGDVYESSFEVIDDDAV